MAARFNPPPGWPPAPDDWRPPADWRPDPTWPQPPPGWQFWIEEEPLWGPAATAGTRTVRPAPSARLVAVLGWGSLIVLVLLGVSGGGVGSGLAVLSMYLIVLGLVALVRGRVRWARLGSRLSGGGLALVALLVLVVGVQNDATTPPRPVLTTVAMATGSESATRAATSEARSAAGSSTSRPVATSTVSMNSTTSATGRASSPPTSSSARSTSVPAPKSPVRKEDRPRSTSPSSSATTRSRTPVDPPGTRSATRTTTADSCDPNYAQACVPIASDVDCAGGSGNGPAYVQGPVRVVGTDIYRLDADGDGWGCES